MFLRAIPAGQPTWSSPTSLAHIGTYRALSCWAPVRLSSAGSRAAREVGPASVADHGVARQELGHPSCDEFGALDVQEMSDALDRALLDVRE
jgi:hypothetical protein